MNYGNKEFDIYKNCSECECILLEDEQNTTLNDMCFDCCEEYHLTKNIPCPMKETCLTDKCNAEKSTGLRVWTCDEFQGHYPVGVSAVVVAENEDVALHWLVEQLKAQGLSGLNYDDKPLTKNDLKPLPVQGGRLVRIIQDGNY